MFFFFNDTATTEIYTLSLHDALPISGSERRPPGHVGVVQGELVRAGDDLRHRDDDLGYAHLRREDTEDRKSTRLNSSHANISYAVFCLKKKKTSLISTY